MPVKTLYYRVNTNWQESIKVCKESQIVDKESINVDKESIIVSIESIKLAKESITVGKEYKSWLLYRLFVNFYRLLANV